ncbi:hypothetical protein [Bradyrhizobium sp. Tv2a-2]|uniref:hypothetical protein n=1 Tax=Bradyrhizobium sp. Tv2a-2 TaxID=113395 RepID=UPI00041D0C6A|nr:hypothetical protein [Bradyrhizobium sp. Tv2a-2]
MKRAIGDDGKPALKQIGYISTPAISLKDPRSARNFGNGPYRIGKMRLQPNKRALIEQQ